MNGDAAITLIMNRLGRRTSTELRAALIAEMSLIQDTTLEGQGMKPWFLRKISTSLVTVSGEELVTLPTDFMSFDEDWGAVYILDPDSTAVDPYTKLEKSLYSEMVKAFSMNTTEDAAMPTNWAHVGLNQIALRGIPQQVYSLKVLYYGKDAPPTDAGSENAWLKHAPDLLIGETGMVAASQYVKDDAVYATFKEQAQRARDRLWQRNEDLKHVDQDYVMGEN